MEIKLCDCDRCKRTFKFEKSDIDVNSYQASYFKVTCPYCNNGCWLSDPDKVVSLPHPSYDRNSGLL